MTDRPDRRTRAIHVLVRIALLTLAWALVVDLSGGFFVRLGAIRISSRTPDAPLWLTAMALAAALYLAPAGLRVRYVRDAFVHLYERLVRRLARPWIASVLAIGLACAVVVVTVVSGARVAAGSDASGYVSEARMFAHGRLVQDEPLMGALPWPYARDAVTPLGYRPASNANALLPTYSPGLPLTMALAHVLFGEAAIYDVVPVFGGIAILATFVVGRYLAGALLGLLAAGLLATSPTFLFLLMMPPMADVPVTAWWMLAFAACTWPGRWSSAAAGVAAGMAVATRPNLLPLLLPIVTLQIWTSRAHPREAITHVSVFGVGAAPAILVVAFLNDYWWGSPLVSGYGRFFDAYSWANGTINFIRYSTWLIESQTLLILLAGLAPLSWLLERDARPHARALVVSGAAFVLLTFGCYIFYLPFESWWYLRFLLPAFPMLLILQAQTLSAIANRALPRVSSAALVVVTLYLMAFGVSFAARHSAFDLKATERRYEAIGAIIADDLPSNAVFLTMQHSGSVRHYTGHPIVRYDVVPPAELDAAIADLIRLGYHPFAVLDDWEEAEFRRRFPTAAVTGTLDDEPVATAGATRIYDLGEPANRASTARAAG